MLDLKHKGIIITGASSGIGKQLAFELAGYDARLFLVARNESRLKTVADEIKNKYPSIHPPETVACDVSDTMAVKNAVRQIIDHAEEIDILINNAGIGIYGPLKNTLPPDFKHLMEVNFMGAVNFTFYTLPHILKQQQGMVVFISSLASLYGIPCYGAYSASKAALRSYSQSLRAELVNTNISVLHVSPDYTKTPFFENEKIVKGARMHNDKMAKVETVARSIVRQIRHKRKETVLSFRAGLLEKARTISPAFVRTYFRKKASKLLTE